ncbi:MAG: TIGR03435 family protein [Terracidiphilus sp.]
MSTTLICMRLLPATAFLAILSICACAHAQPAQPFFEVASVRPSQHEVGPDYNNQITSSLAGFIGRNVTLKRLIAEAWHCQINQVEGPPWLDRNEYDIETRLPEGAGKEQIPLMLRSLLADRFHLKEHSETRSMRVYELAISPGGLKIHPVEPGSAKPAQPGGFHFRGEMRQFADLLAVQFSIPEAENPNLPVKAGGPPIPVLDNTRLQGVYDFTVDIRPELGTDAFTGWKRALHDQLGLNVENRKADVAVVLVDDASKTPTGN